MRKNYVLVTLTIVLLNACSKKDDTSTNPPQNQNKVEITSVAPLSGASGTVLTIEGKNFDTVLSNNKVRVDNINAKILSGSTTFLKAIIPDGVSNGLIKVNNATDSSSWNSDKKFQILDIYVGGEEDSSAKYWKNGIVYELPSQNILYNGMATDVKEVGADLYWIGSNYRGIMLWKNNQKTDYTLTGKTYVQMRNTLRGTIYNNVAYIPASYYYFVNHYPSFWNNYDIGYWQNDQWYNLYSTIGVSAYLNNIQVVDGNILAVGNIGDTAVYFKNKQRLNLFIASGATLTEINVQGKDTVITCSRQGSYYDSAFYSLNGKFHALELPESNSKATTTVSQTLIHNGDVYMVGNVYQSGGYVGILWKNGKISNKESHNSVMYWNFTFYGDDIYITGRDTSGHAAYWINEQEYAIGSKENYNVGYSILLKKHQ